ncbi:MAG TPA: bifunctional glutamate N-acetyltransferase/amino-acid acetyltransferase ArgJ [Chloroflexota bacterium]|nr:bifunctional glutamate N-acetyltransferase/amino-acid acetyltransferase ArgJ [Chloroflexota bacterium]
MTFAAEQIELVAGGGVTTPRGFRAGAVSAGVKAGADRLDVAVVVAHAPCTAAAVFTQCAVVAAPVLLSRQRVADGRAQGIVLNSGNANACTGAPGLAAARRMADIAAKTVGIDPDLMLVASTGVIGVPLPIDRIVRALGSVTPTVEGGHDAAQAILTTDRVPKEAALRFDVGGRSICVGGMAKGSGMIHPNMATLLSVITTDAPLEPHFAAGVLKRCVSRTFNQVSVDGDTSTNDMVALFGSGAAGGAPIGAGGAEAAAFEGALERVCTELARLIARDGEGATRLIEVAVDGARSEADAQLVARSVIRSNLVKAAIYGRDPNWGRILAAVGNAGVQIDPNAIDAWIGGHRVAAGGAAVDFDAQEVSEAMGVDEVQIRVSLNAGEANGRAWGCDLTEGYVKINAEYTT